MGIIHKLGRKKTEQLGTVLSLDIKAVDTDLLKFESPQFHYLDFFEDNLVITTKVIAKILVDTEDGMEETEGFEIDDITVIYKDHINCLQRQYSPEHSRPCVTIHADNIKFEIHFENMAEASEFLKIVKDWKGAKTH